MSLDAWPLSKKTIARALDVRHLNPEPSGTEEFHYVCDGQDYFLYCPDAPDFVIKHFVCMDELRFFDDATLMSAIHSVNNRSHQVKVAFTGDDKAALLFQLCSRERLYVDFLNSIVTLTRKLDDVVTSFRMACMLCSEEGVLEAMEEVDHMWDSRDNPFEKALRKQ